MSLLPLFAVALLLVLVLAAAAVTHRLRHPPRKTYASALAHGWPTHPDELDRRSQDVTFRLTHGYDTPGWLIVGDRPDGPTVILIHGFADARYNALACALLWPHASQLVLFDLPGHGESTAPRCHLGTREGDDVRHLLDQIDTTHGVVLFGYSMGAGIALAAAADRPDDPRLRGVIAEGLYRFWHQPVASTLRARHWPARLILPLVGAALRLLSPGWRAYDRVAQARRVACPLLVLHGRRDAICDYADAVAIADAAPHGQLITFPEGRHLDLARCDETRYRTAVQSFFGRLPHHQISQPHP